MENFKETYMKAYKPEFEDGPEKTWISSDEILAVAAHEKWDD
jgi:hypothetical protein